jgi:hypothetical protein
MVPSPKLCEQKRILLEKYAFLVRQYSEGVAHLGQIHAHDESSFRVALDDIRKLRAHSDEALLQLDRHIAEHAC